MKGFIAYSSKTGNTKRMAQYLYDALKENRDLVLLDLKDKPDLSGYDYGLLGGWCDRALPDKAVMKALERAPKKLGLFLTLGAMPDSEHGARAMEGLKKCLADHEKESLGTYLCPGKVDEKLAARIDLLVFVPKDAREQMKEASEKSREATEDELKEAAVYFTEQLEKGGIR
ncbi:flavodoxin family protein [Aedoeadaptatus coli]|uniref:flavodoxin family protein n=1 Tax=Aedoeadaptatus coli TaxID=2058292 RepID=UPI000D553405|nr:flavodoxin family protein [Peptoniphilus coli]